MSPISQLKNKGNTDYKPKKWLRFMRHCDFQMFLLLVQEFHDSNLPSKWQAKILRQKTLILTWLQV